MAQPGFAHAAVASGEPSNSQNDREFSARWFERFSPSTAREMVGRLPGFVPKEVEDTRGLGQASSNILINGARSSGKQDSALALLARIPASSVKMIIIRDGASLGIAGLSGDVADVIVDEQGLSGRWLLRSHHRKRIDAIWNRVDVSLSGKRQNLSWTLNASNIPDRFGHWGPELVYGPDGQLTERRDEFARYSIDRHTGSVSLNWTPDGGGVGNFSYLYRERVQDNFETSAQMPVDGSEGRRRLFDYLQERETQELSLDYEFDLGSVRQKLIYYDRREDYPSTSNSTRENFIGVESTRTLFSRLAEDGERIVRSETSLNTADKALWQLSLEGVYNFTEVNAQAFESIAGGPLIEQVLAGGSSKVEENRYEVMFTHGRDLSDSTRLQASFGAEISQLEQSGVGGREREFTRPKGFISLSHQLSTSTLMSAKLAREVGQLDFLDFVSSLDLEDEEANDGNPDLVPQQSWLLEARLEHQLKSWGELSARLWFEEVDDIVDEVPGPNNGSAVGNIDSAQRYGVSLVSTVSFDSLGWPGARLDLEYEIVGSRVEDPLTGQERRISGEAISVFFAELRHDVKGTPWAWGTNYWYESLATNSGIVQTSIVGTSQGETRAFIEHKDVFGMKASLLVRNLFDSREELDRSVYQQQRGGPLAFREVRQRRFGPVFEFQIEGSF